MAPQNGLRTGPIVGWAPPTNDKIPHLGTAHQMAKNSKPPVVGDVILQLHVRGGGGQCPPYGSMGVVVGSAHPTVRWGRWWAVPTLRVPQVGHCPPFELKIHDPWRWGQTILTDQKPSAYDWVSILPIGPCRRLSAKRPQGITGGSFHIIYAFMRYSFPIVSNRICTRGRASGPGTLVSILSHQ